VSYFSFTRNPLWITLGGRISRKNSPIKNILLLTFSLDNNMIFPTQDFAHRGDLVQNRRNKGPYFEGRLDRPLNFHDQRNTREPWKSPLARPLAKGGWGDLEVIFYVIITG
jgi:hypothetical protein